jgi:hypothetical protein
MRRVLMVLLAAVPLLAEFHAVRFEFQASGCASCTESLADRFGRVRGVESAKLEPPAALSVKLAAGNRVTLERLRDVLQQDGTRAVAAEVDVEGDREGELLRVGAMSYRLKGAAPAGGRVRLKGRVRDWTATPLTIELAE